MAGKPSVCPKVPSDHFKKKVTFKMKVEVPGICEQCIAKPMLLGYTIFSEGRNGRNRH